MKSHATPVLSLMLLAVAACQKQAPAPASTPPPMTAPSAIAPAPLSVVSVTLGSSLAPDKRVAQAKDVFGPNDTVYAAVETAGRGHAKLRALWTFVKGDKTARVEETVIEFDAATPTVNEFHVSKPGGWPAGDYKVDVFLGEAAAPAITRTFKVE